MSKSVRLRADPSIIRVGIRKNSKDNTYTASVSYTSKYIISQRHKDSSYIDACVQAIANSAEDAVMGVLRKARNASPPFKGIDLEMEWTYDHPQKV